MSDLGLHIKVIAIDPEQGWAYVTETDRIFLIKPPYKKEFLETTTQQAVELAYCSGYFEIPPDELETTVFDSWQNLFEALQKIIINKRLTRREKQPSIEEVYKSLRSLPSNGILVALEYIRCQFIGRGAFIEAKGLLKILDTADAIMKSESLRRKWQAIVKECEQKSSLPPDDYSKIYPVPSPADADMEKETIPQLPSIVYTHFLQMKKNKKKRKSE